MDEIKPEAAYFAEENGCRAGYIFVNITESNEIVKLSEPWFLAFQAAIKIVPAMTPQDLGAAGPYLEHAAKTYSKA